MVVPAGKLRSNYRMSAFVECWEVDMGCSCSLVDEVPFDLDFEEFHDFLDSSLGGLGGIGTIWMVIVGDYRRHGCCYRGNKDHLDIGWSIWSTFYLADVTSTCYAQSTRAEVELERVSW